MVPHSALDPFGIIMKLLDLILVVDLLSNSIGMMYKNVNYNFCIGTLHIDFPSLNDEGDYMLIASNEHGTTNRTIEVDFKRELPDGIFENSAFPEFMPFIPPPNMSVGPNKVAIIPMMDNPNNPSNGTQIPFIPWIGNLNNHSIGKQNEDVGFKVHISSN